MDLRSLYGLYNTITLGVNGTPMRAFTELSESDRWALAFFVANLRAGTDQVARGEALWKQGQGGRTAFGDLRALVTTTRAEARRAGGAPLAAIQAYLTAHPQAIRAAGPAPLDVTRGSWKRRCRPIEGRSGTRAAAGDCRLSRRF